MKASLRSHFRRLQTGHPQSGDAVAPRRHACAAHPSLPLLFALAIGIAALLLPGSTCHAQGTVNFNNRVLGVVVAPVYGPELSDSTLVLSGNTTAGTPPGTTTYGGPLLSGGNYFAELWAGPPSASEAELTPVARTIFRTGILPGFIVPPAAPVAIPGPPEGGLATLQVRVWDNQRSNILSWGQAQANATTVASGASLIFLSTLGGAGSPPLNLTGLRSFNLHFAATSHLKIGQSVVAGGGGPSSNGGFQLNSTVGQFDASASSGQSLSVAGGFWNVYAVLALGAPLLSVERLAANNVRIFWPGPATGFVLDETTVLAASPATTAWSAVPLPYQTNSTHISITVPTPVGRKYYRLRRP